MPLAVVVADPVEDVVAAKTIVEGNHGTELTTVVIGLMLVTPSSEMVVPASVTLSLIEVAGKGGAVVVGGTVLLPVGGAIEEELKEMVPEVITGGSCETVVDVELVSVPGMLVVVVGSSVTGRLVVVSGAMVVLFPIGGSEESPLGIGADVVSLVGGSVTVAVSETVVDIPVPGSMLVGVTDEVAFCDGSTKLEIIESMSLKIELSGSDSLVLDELVTMPVGAKRIEDVVIVGSAGSDDELAGSTTVDDSSGNDDVGSGAALLVLLLEGSGS